MNERPPQPFSWGAWIGGFFVALITGLILNFVLGFLAISTMSSRFAILIELIPGVLLALLAVRRWRDAFPQGFLVGAAVVVMIGGICGTMLGSGLR